MVLCGCTETKIGAIKPTRAVDQWENRWLSKSVCIAPCWEGIEPGRTTVDEASAILRSKSNGRFTILDASASYVAANGETRKQVNWLDASLTEGKTSALDYAQGPSPVVDFIILATDRDFRVGELVSAFGAPSEVETVSYSFTEREIKSEKHRVILFFYSYGIAATLASLQNEQTAITPELQLERIILFNPTLDHTYLFGMLEVKRSRISIWNGYQSFDNYCTRLAAGTCYQ